MKAIAHATVQSTGVRYRHEIQTGTHALVTDEPVAIGGQDAGPAPYDYILAGLGACTAITLRMYAEKKAWELGQLTVRLELQRDREGETRIERTLHATATLSEEQWERLLDIASKTPVTRTLQTGTAISTRRADNA